jgi:outer membrane protein TolC
VRERVRQFGIAFVIAACPAVCGAQTTLTLREAIDRALQERPSLKAEAERVNVATALRDQAGKYANPELFFQNENLRPGQAYARDVDTLAYVTQPLDVFGKRTARMAAADEGTARVRAEYALARIDTIRRVSLAYWAARGAQDTRDLLSAAADTFQRIVDYHEAQLTVGAIAEQDVLRIRLEGERLRIGASLAALQATRARVELLKQMGDAVDRQVLLTDPLDRRAQSAPVAIEQALAQHPAMTAARAALTEARARARVQQVAARPNVTALVGYKRTLLRDHPEGMNTAVAGVAVTLPLLDRNEGNRAAADADVRRAGNLLEAAEKDLRADYETARQDYELRRTEVATLLAPLRDHAVQIAGIAQAAYLQAGTDLLRLLDAERARLDAEAAWVQGMVEYQQSVVNLEAAEGVTR